MATPTKRPSRKQAIRQRDERGETILTAVFLLVALIMIALTRFSGGV